MNDTKTTRGAVTQARRKADLEIPLDGMTVGELGDLLGRLAKRKNVYQRKESQALQMMKGCEADAAAAHAMILKAGERIKDVLDVLSDVK